MPEESALNNRPEPRREHYGYSKDFMKAHQTWENGQDVAWSHVNHDIAHQQIADELKRLALSLSWKINATELEAAWKGAIDSSPDSLNQIFTTYIDEREQECKKAAEGVFAIYINLWPDDNKIDEADYLRSIYRFAVRPQIDDFRSRIHEYVESILGGRRELVFAVRNSFRKFEQSTKEQKWHWRNKIESMAVAYDPSHAGDLISEEEGSPGTAPDANGVPGGTAVHDGQSEKETPIDHVESAPGLEYRFASEGKAWRISFGTERDLLTDKSVGYKYISTLLQKAGHEIRAIDLRASVNAGGQTVVSSRNLDADELHVSKAQYEPVIDKKVYEDAANDLKAQLDEARERGESEKVEEYLVQLEFIRNELDKNTGRFGRARSFTDEEERARSSITQAIIRAYANIEIKCPSMANHLRSKLSTGFKLVYSDTTLNWIF